MDILEEARRRLGQPSTEYDVIAALPDSVSAQPLGLVEERKRHQVRIARPVATAAGL